jgi:isoquinoline 1-oxidoreductase beta subunit
LSPANTGRRHFLIGVGVIAGGVAAGQLLRPYLVGGSEAAPKEFKPHAFVRIGADDRVTVIIGKSEMGQGVSIGLPMILAEELDVNPQRLAVEIAGIDPAFNHPFIPAQFIGGSMSVMTTYEALRRVGATARRMIVQAAATEWGVPAAQLRTEDGVVFAPDGRSATYGKFVEAASGRPVPAQESVALKNRADFRYIGKPQRRLDSRIKVNGAAQFGIDVNLPNMLVAVVARPPQFGALVRSFDASQARAVRGVVEVKPVPSGVAVISEHTWAAIKGRGALRIEWRDGPGATLSTARLRTEHRALLARTGLLAKNQGDALAALSEARRKIDVEYELPYLAHACMEPLNAVAWVKNDRCEMWVARKASRRMRYSWRKHSAFRPPTSRSTPPFSVAASGVARVATRIFRSRRRTSPRVSIGRSRWCGRAKTIPAAATTDLLASIGCKRPSAPMVCRSPTSIATSASRYSPTRSSAVR